MKNGIRQFVTKTIFWFKKKTQLSISTSIHYLFSHKFKTNHQNLKKIESKNSTIYKPHHLNFCNSMKGNVGKMLLMNIESNKNTIRRHVSHPHLCFSLSLLSHPMQLCNHISWLISDSVPSARRYKWWLFCTSPRGDVCLLFAFLCELFVTLIFISMLFITNAIFQDLSLNSFHNFCWLFFPHGTCMFVCDGWYYLVV